MSIHEYRAAQHILHTHPPFYALIMAAFMRADTGNTERLATAFPELYIETRDRHNAPGAVLPSDPVTP